ncbi:MAG TPA: hypothetical protein VFS00_35135, partial [Polyangiaceae bacterium]|nr:hypothetical protein [Polyangiaceae bacterium]
AEAIGPALRETADAEPRRKRLLGLVMADYSLAAQAEGGPVDAALLALEREAADERAARLERGVTERRDRHCLTALAELGRARAGDVVGRVLEEETLDGLTSTALALVEAWADPAYHAALLRLAWRAALSNNAPGPFLRTRALRLVLGAYRADTLPPDLRALALAALREDARSSEADAGLLLFLLEPTDGVLRLARALRHEVPMARGEAAAYLALIGTAEAAAALRAAGTPEAAATLALLRGDEPEAPAEPAYELIEWRGQPRKVYRFDDLMSAALPEWVRDAIDEARERYGPLLERWWASLTPALARLRADLRPRARLRRLRGLRCLRRRSGLCRLRGLRYPRHLRELLGGLRPLRACLRSLRTRRRRLRARARRFLRPGLRPGRLADNCLVPRDVRLDGHATHGLAD